MDHDPSHGRTVLPTGDRCGGRRTIRPVGLRRFHPGTSTDDVAQRLRYLAIVEDALDAVTLDRLHGDLRSFVGQLSSGSTGA